MLSNIGEGFTEGKNILSYIEGEGDFVVFHNIGVSDQWTKKYLVCHEMSENDENWTAPSYIIGDQWRITKKVQFKDGRIKVFVKHLSESDYISCFEN